MQHRIDYVTIGGKTNGRFWKISAHYCLAMDMVEVVWFPQNGVKPFAENPPFDRIEVPTYDEAYMVVKHSATIRNVVEILAAFDGWALRGMRCAPFSKLPYAFDVETIRDMIGDLQQQEGYENLHHFPKDLMDKIGFVPVSLLVGMLLAKANA